MKIKYILLTSSAIFSLLLLQNCGPGECEPHTPTHTKYSISAADKSKIPFTGTDTLVYISTDGDTAILYGQGKKVFIDAVQKNSGGDPGCPKVNYNDFENIEFTYKGNNWNLNYIFIDINASVYAPAQTNADITIGQTKYNTYLGSLNYESKYLGSVEINSNYYLGKEIVGFANLPCLYNYKFGFLKITTANKVWLKKM